MGGCTSTESGPSIVFNLDIDLETEQNKEILKILSKAPELLQSLNDYSGCDEYIKEVCIIHFLAFVYFFKQTL